MLLAGLLQLVWSYRDTDRVFRGTVPLRVDVLPGTRLVSVLVARFTCVLLLLCERQVLLLIVPVRFGEAVDGPTRNINVRDFWSVYTPLSLSLIHI